MNHKTQILYWNNCWFTNVGEAFIDIGAMKLIQNIFPSANIGCCSNMTHYYVNDCQRGNPDELAEKKLWRTFRPQDYFQADYIILAGMFVSLQLFDDTYTGFQTKRTVDELVRNGAKLIFLGLGAEQYSKEETYEFQKWMEEVNPALIVTRDLETYDNLKDVCPCIRGIDCAFWIDEVFNPKGFLKNDYDIVSFNRSKEPAVFSEKWERSIIRPFHFPYELNSKDIREGILISDTPYDYLTAYANANMVYTDLVHATIISLMYGTPVRYYYVDKRSNTFYSFNEVQDDNGILTVSHEALVTKRQEIEDTIRNYLK